MKTTSSPARLMFTIVLLIILVLNGAMTALFGWTYLAGAFGGDSVFAHLAGALYALLILDLAAIAYFAVYKSAAETKSQRTITLVVGSVALAGSIFATIVQLSNSSFGLTAFGAYQETIENIALVLLIGLTAVHVLVFILYGLFSTEGRIKQKAISIQTQVQDDAMKELDSKMDGITASLADQMARELQRMILSNMGFSSTGEHEASTLRETTKGRKIKPRPSFSLFGDGGKNNPAATTAHDESERPT